MIEDLFKHFHFGTLLAQACPPAWEPPGLGLPGPIQTHSPGPVRNCSLRKEGGWPSTEMPSCFKNILILYPSSSLMIAEQQECCDHDFVDDELGLWITSQFSHCCGIHLQDDCLQPVLVFKQDIPLEIYFYGSCKIIDFLSVAVKILSENFCRSNVRLNI